jgi:hypothetical protein
MKRQGDSAAVGTRAVVTADDAARAQRGLQGARSECSLDMRDLGMCGRCGGGSGRRGGEDATRRAHVCGAARWSAGERHRSVTSPDLFLSTAFDQTFLQKPELNALKCK